MKQEFNFYQDVKVTVWERRKVTIEAESMEEALKFINDHVDDDVYDLECNHDCITVDEMEELFNTSENMRPEDNGGFSTKEWCETDFPYNCIAHNGEKI